ncbi:hypothetical protein [uncultured Aquimarina sp.]|uniref:hypothetical protein n=1 Tax=uncultured Aquimarina sp. TaxID=575652 RepID=UPI002625C565|nr:hypothetical protein [uncultured Aquimarina sp.]
MRNSRLLFPIILLSSVYSLYSQSIKDPSLSSKKSSTLIIDSIPVIPSKNYRLTKIDINTNYRKVFFCHSLTLDNLTFDYYGINKYFGVRNNAFSHESLFDPMAPNSFRRQSWDNPCGTDSFGVGVLVGSIQLISSLFEK